MVAKRAGTATRKVLRWHPLHSALATFALTVCAGSAQAGPQGGEVVAGVGNIGRAGNDVTVISQQSQRLSINWDSFNVAAHESVVFQQPGSSSIALNRIFDQNPSQILGAIDANGQVFLINPSGIVFGESARVNLHGLVASSLDLSTEDFMSGNYDLASLSESAGGLVVNRGLIQAATGGSVTLVGGAVANDGLIVADYGQVNLAAGKRATLDFDGDRLMLFEVSEQLFENAGGQASAVSNSGTIQADGGQVLLSGSAASDVFGSVVNNSGVIRAGRIENVGGVVRLVAGGGTVLHTGEIDVSGTQQGGRVEVLGDRVGLFDGAKITADGATGGGTVLVGGDYMGSNPDVMNADRTYVGATTDISADATVDGDGGTIIVWSDEVTRAYGALSARGGAEGGDGGLIETSSREFLDVVRTPDVTAPNGDGGTWLIDPNNIEIVAAGGCANIDGCPTPGGPNFNTTDDSAQIGVDLINNALTGGADVVITTGSTGANTQVGNITWASGVTLDTDGGNGGSLTLDADSAILIDGTITDSTGANDSIDLILIAGNNVTINGTIDLINGTLTAGTAGTGLGGNFTLGATGMVSASAVSVFADGDLTMQGTLTIGGVGALTVDLNAGQADAGSTVLLDFAGLTGATTTVNGGGGADLFTVSANLSATLNGGGGNDSFTLAGGVLTGTINGDGGTNTLVGDNVATTWVLNGATSGTVTGVTAGFTGIDVAQGGTMADTFTVTGAWAGDANGGSGADDFTLDGGTVGGSIDGEAGNDSLTGDDVATSWTLSAAQAGTVTGVAGGFSGIASVFGGSAVDTIEITGPWGGFVLGGDDADVFTLNGGTVGGSINGEGGMDILVADDVPNTWQLNGATNGNLTGLGGGFSNIFTVTGGNAGDTFAIAGAWLGDVNGGAGTDEFDFAATGSVGGTLDGGAGTDTIDWTAYGTAISLLVSGAGASDGFAGSEAATVANGFDNIDTLLNTGLGDTFTAGDANNTWVLTSDNDFTLNGVNWTDFANVVGGSMTDDFTVSGMWAGNVSGGDGGADDGDDSLTLDGGTIGGFFAGGSGTNTLTGDASSTAWTLSAERDGTVTGIAGGFTGIDAVVGGSAGDTFTVTGTNVANTWMGSIDGGSSVGDLLAGADLVNTWVLDGLQTGTLNGAAFTGIETARGGDMVDNFTVTGGFGTGVGSLLGRIEGQGADDTITLGVNGAVTVIDGGLGADVLIAADRDNEVTLTGTSTGNIADRVVSFFNMRIFQGGSMADTITITGNWTSDVNGGEGNDSFTLSGGGTVGGAIDGEGGTDTLVADDVANTWTISGDGSGSVTGVTGGYVGIESGVGGSDTDNFVFQAGGILDAIDGDAGSDTIDWTGYGSAIALILAGSGSTDGFAGSETTTVSAGFDNIDTLLNPGLGDSFTAPDAINTWTLTSDNDFTLNGVNWTDFADVTGGSMADAFTVSGAWAGNVSGGAGADSFTLASGTVGGALAGNGGTDTLTGDNVANSWSFTGDGSGTVTGVTGGFTSIEASVGGTDTDNFAFQPTGVMASIDGAAGTDTIDWSAYGTAIGLTITGSGSTDGNAGSEATTIPTGFDNIDAFIGSGLGDSFIAQDINNTWDLNGVDDFILNGVQFNDFANVVGGSLVDTFTISAAFAGNVSGGDGDDTFTLTTGSVGGTIDGNGGTNTLTAADAFNTWILTGATAGTVTGVTGGFTNIDNIVGGSSGDDVAVNAAWDGAVSTGAGIDQIVFAAGSSIGGVVDGGLGTDTLDWSGFGTALDFILTGTGSSDGFAGAETGSVPDGFDNFDTFVTTGLGDSFTAPNTANVWDLNGDDDFLLNGVQWNGFADVNGGDLVDTFTVSAAFGGDVNGGDGSDAFILTTGTVGGTVRGQGGDDTL
ncbi:MAG: filamentous hemagglutinin N-terminal domain-containing protein, partial [Pseudomonadota bacterium]